MKATPKMFFEVERGIVHCEAANGQDYTLCGFTLDGDMGETVEIVASKINCPDCVGILRFCETVPKRSISTAERGGDG